MPLFSELEKKIIQEIAEADSGALLGWTLRGILFTKGEAAFACLGFVNREPIFSLMCQNNGSKSHEEVRERMATFISLMQWLEDNRMVLLNTHGNRSNSLFYEESKTMHYSPKVDEHATTYESVCYYDEVAPGNVFRYRANYFNGYASSLQCIGITCKDGASLNPCQTSSKMLIQLAEFLFSAAYPTIALKELIADDFRTHDEKVAENAMKSAELQVVKAQWTLVIAILTLLFTVVYALFSEQRPQVSFIVLAFLMLAVGCLGAIIGKRS